MIYAASGNCHIYVDADADLQFAQDIVINAKVQRPGVCNAAETLLVHEHVAERFLPRVLHALHDAGVTLHGDTATRRVVGELHIREATEHDWDTEYLALEMAVRVVASVEEAIEHINRHGSGHSEAIVTGSATAVRIFQMEVDAACIYVNASTRFTDGGEFGWVPRSATRPRSCMSAARSGCASCARSSTWSRAPGTFGPDRSALS